MSPRLFVVAIFIITSMWSSSASAQRRPPPVGADRNARDPTSDIKGRSNEIERIKREADHPEERPALPAFPQIKEDFERLQIVNSDILQAGMRAGTLPYKQISEAAAEMKKRAIRLKSNLFPSDSGERPKEKETKGPQDMKSLLAALDSALFSFVSSPIFQNIKVVDPQDSLKAQAELEKVIKLSIKLRKEADELKKANGEAGQP